MTRLVIALASVLLAIACSGKAKPATTGGGDPTLVKKVSVSWGFSVEGEMTDVFLALTDETGKQVSHPLGRYKGTCAKISPPAEMNALTGVGCVTGGGGTELHAVLQGNEIIVMQMGTSPGVTPDPMAREAVKRVAYPVGAGIEAAP